MKTKAQRWERVEEIFHQALEQPPDTREEWLKVVCAGDAGLHAEVASLLKSDNAAGPGLVGAHVRQAVLDLAVPDASDEVSKSAMEGRLVGSWRLIRELGHGGMGAVYIAERADQQYDSRAAVKLVSRGLNTDFTLRRFRRERQILARLEAGAPQHLEADRRRNHR
jgi:eukaryotic-like serine/threonine-protein kinase